MPTQGGFGQNSTHMQAVRRATRDAPPRCSAAEAYYALEHVREAVVTLCPTSRWLELAANAYPCMSSFVDIGSNKGHTGASFFGLWAREASGLRGVHHWWQSAYNSSQSHCGYCRDCLEIDRARLVNCTENTAAPTQLHTIQVHSFDGSRSLVNHIRTSASRLFPRLRENWSVHWGVVSNRSGMATFAQGPFGAETSHIIDPSAATDSARQKDSRSTFEQVRVWTVDEFARAHGLQSIDVLKIDAEGHDPMVVYGSRESLHTRRIKLLFFEHNMYPSWVSIRLEAIVVELDEAGYVCYLGGEVAMVRLTGCWRDEWDVFHPQTGLIHGGNRALGVNVFCASLAHAPALVDAYEAASLRLGRNVVDMVAACEGLCRPQVKSRWDRARIAYKSNRSLTGARVQIAKEAGLPLPTFT